MHFHHREFRGRRVGWRNSPDIRSLSERSVDLFDRLIEYVDDWGRCPFDPMDFAIDSYRDRFIRNKDQTMRTVRLCLTELSLTPRLRTWSNKLQPPNETLKNYPLWTDRTLKAACKDPESIASQNLPTSLGDAMALVSQEDPVGIVRASAYESLIVQYVADGRLYLQLTGWLRHHNPKPNAQDSKFPLPRNTGAIITAGALWNNTMTDRQYREEQNLRAIKRQQAKDRKRREAQNPRNQGEEIRI